MLGSEQVTAGVAGIQAWAEVVGKRSVRSLIIRTRQVFFVRMAVSPRPNSGRISFGLTIFLSAFLLFWVQLLLGKYVLPWFGGAPAVWTTCMLFFQVLLLGGYIYAHVLNSSRLSPRTQIYVHCVLLLASLVWLACASTAWNSPLTPGPNWKPNGADNPVWHIVALLSVSVGLPYFVLSSTGPLLQSWYSGIHKGSPYRLYALSNFGSFLALLAFPLVLEPGLRTKAQAWLWSATFLIFVLGCVYCAHLFGMASGNDLSGFANDDSPPQTTTKEGTKLLPPSRWDSLVWLGLSASASVMFLATTNQICQDIGVVPLLWILPLGIYLLTFVICFEHERWYSRGWYHPLFAMAIFAACFVLNNGAINNLVGQIAIYTSVLFIVSMVCNGELARCKPSPHFLTQFYLTVAAGGALGGVLVALAAPHIFRGFWEYQSGLWMSALLLTIILVRDKQSWLYQSKVGSPVVVVGVAILLPESAALARGQLHQPVTYISVLVVVFMVFFVVANRNQPPVSQAREKVVPIFCWVALLVFAGGLFANVQGQIRDTVVSSRNFFGVLAITKQNTNDPERAAYSLVHGRIVHGYQLRAAAERRSPTAYYARNSGVGLAITRSAAEPLGGDEGLRIGVVGLGVGTIAAYGKGKDQIRFYEINPAVIRMASDQRYFTFLSDSPAKIEIIPGDARLSMQRELDRNQRQDFDVLVIDAFSGDAIPVHLLTQEAFAIYFRQLRQPSGILAIHITNTYLDLRPVVVEAAEHFGFKAVLVNSAGDGRLSQDAEWMLVSRNSFAPGSELDANRLSKEGSDLCCNHPWTDDYSNLIQILKR